MSAKRSKFIFVFETFVTRNVHFQAKVSIHVLGKVKRMTS